MNYAFQQLEQRHPTAYRRLLWAGLITTLICGLISMSNFVHHRKPLIYPGVAAPRGETVSTSGGLVPVDKVKRLPGRDGTAPVQNVAVPQIPAGDEIRGLGRIMNAQKFGDSQWPALNALWNRESGWNPAARNRRSGACGIPQALPCSKIHDMSVRGQIDWGFNYIERRYGTPSGAWRHWLSFGWY